MDLQLTYDSFETLDFDEDCYMNVSLAENNKTFPLHWHTEAEIIMPLEGNLIVNVNGKSHNLMANDLLFVSIGELHEMTIPSEGSRIILQFDFSLINNLRDFNASISILRSIKLISKETDPDIHNQIQNLMLDIRDVYESNCEFKNATMYSHLLQIYVLIAQKYITMAHLFSDITVGRQQEYIAKFTQVFSYINENFTQSLTLEELADYAGFSKFHFSRLFKQFTNMALYDYLNEKRISKAELLLLNPNMTVTEVAMQAGFNSISSFNRVFKASKDCTPTQYKHLYDSH